MKRTNWLARYSSNITVALAATATLLALTSSAIAAEAVAPASSTASQSGTKMTGVFTGQYVDGMPVYRLPPIEVIAKRKTRPAGVARLAPSKVATIAGDSTPHTATAGVHCSRTKVAKPYESC